MCPGAARTTSWSHRLYSTGQGTWYTLAHRPDKVFAAAPLSGYLSIQTYVPFQLWSPIDPRKRGVLDFAIASYRHELLAPNFKGISIYQQHGSVDDNVPAYNSKLMHQLISQTGWSSNYSEVTGKNHWWDGVMTTPGLVDFYHEQFQTSRPSVVAQGVDDFTIVIANPADTGSKFGIRVLYLQDPGQLGRLRVTKNKDTGAWHLEPENIMALEIDSTFAISAVEFDSPELTETKSFAVPQDETKALFQRGRDGFHKVINHLFPQLLEESDKANADCGIGSSSQEDRPLRRIGCNTS
jgi:hypothetical protein